jgi:hypothetical protein
MHWVISRGISAVKSETPQPELHPGWSSTGFCDRALRALSSQTRPAWTSSRENLLWSAQRTAVLTVPPENAEWEWMLLRSGKGDCCQQRC